MTNFRTGPALPPGCGSRVRVPPLLSRSSLAGGLVAGLAEHPAERAEAMEDPRADRADRATADAGDLLMAHALVVEQQDRHALGLRQPLDGLAHLVLLQARQ